MYVKPQKRKPSCQCVPFPVPKCHCHHSGADRHVLAGGDRCEKAVVWVAESSHTFSPHSSLSCAQSCTSRPALRVQWALPLGYGQCPSSRGWPLLKSSQGMSKAERRRVCPRRGVGWKRGMERRYWKNLVQGLPKQRQWWNTSHCKGRKEGSEGGWGRGGRKDKS